MRIKNSLNNVMTNFIIYFVKTILAFIVRSILIKSVAQEYVGLKELFTNILTVLSIAELGISSAIGFSLYKPLIDKDNETISSIMTMFKKMYRVIGTVIFAVGLLIMPMLPIIVKKSIDDMFLIYLIFLINSCCSYFVSYKDILIMSDQKSYKIAPYNLIFTIISSLAEIVILSYTKNFVLYSLCKIICLIVQRIIVNNYITNEYKNINFDTKIDVPKETKKEITENVKALFFHKIGDTMINGTDNIIISMFIGINTVGIYSNYLMITTYIMSVINIVYNGILASMGNFLATESEERKYEIFKKINFLGFSMFGISTVVLINIFNLFVEILANKEYLFEFGTVALIVLNFYITGMRVPVSNIKIAAGIFKKDKYTPIFQSFINISLSIILGIKYGINGVLLGTFFSSIFPSIQRPYIVFKDILHKNFGIYISEYIKRFSFLIFTTIITLYVNSLISYNSIIAETVIKTITTIVIFITMFLVVFRKNHELSYYIEFLKSIIRRDKV